MIRRILISGASVAGTTAAWWLGRLGYDVTVIERSAVFRDGGQNIDVRGMGRDVLHRMGLEQAALDFGTGEIGTAWIDADGRIAAKFITEELAGDGPTAELEILRGDLAKLLYEAASGHAFFRFGTTIERIEDDDSDVRITFANGDVETFDLLIIAEGVGSSSRDLVFPEENDPRWMDLTIGYFTIPRTDDDDRMWRWYNAPGGRSISLRPDMHGTTRANLAIQQAPRGEQDWDAARQKAYLSEAFADAGWEAPRIIAGMNATDDFYFDVLRQVRMSRWSKGRVVLVGDGAWCATPLAGIGATLAIVGAYVLAGELSLNDDPAAALSRYENAIRSLVEDAQNIPRIGPRLMHPQSRLGIHLLHGVLGIAASPTLQNVAGRMFSREGETIDLSSYPVFPLD